MNFVFMKQDFQTEAVNAVCEVFVGQRKQGLTEYELDLGIRAKKVQGTMFVDDDDGLGYRNAEVDLTTDQLLRNINILQAITYVPSGEPEYTREIFNMSKASEEYQFRPVEKAKNDCAMKLFNEISTAGVKYHYVDSYRTLIDDVMKRDL